MAVLQHGNGVSVSFANDTSPSIEGVAKAVTLPSSTWGEIDITTLSNSSVETKAPTPLEVTGDGSITMTYAEADIAKWRALGGTTQLVTFTLAGSTSLAFYAFAKEISFSEYSNTEQPTVTVTIGVANDNAGTETAVAIS